MKLTLEPEERDAHLSLKDREAKAHDLLHKALEQLEPGVSRPRGGELQAIEDLSEQMQTRYQRRMERMLSDLAGLLEKP